MLAVLVAAVHLGAAGNIGQPGIEGVCNFDILALCICANSRPCICRIATEQIIRNYAYNDIIGELRQTVLLAVSPAIFAAARLVRSEVGMPLPVNEVNFVVVRLIDSFIIQPIGVAFCFDGQSDVASFVGVRICRIPISLQSRIRSVFCESEKHSSVVIISHINALTIQQASYPIRVMTNVCILIAVRTGQGLCQHCLVRRHTRSRHCNMDGPCDESTFRRCLFACIFFPKVVSVFRIGPYLGLALVLVAPVILPIVLDVHSFCGITDVVGCVIRDGIVVFLAVVASYQAAEIICPGS